MDKKDSEKQRRLAEALRANLKKRKMPAETPSPSDAPGKGDER